MDAKLNLDDKDTITAFLRDEVCRTVKSANARSKTLFGRLKRSGLRPMTPKLRT